MNGKDLYKSKVTKGLLTSALGMILFFGFDKVVPIDQISPIVGIFVDSIFGLIIAGGKGLALYGRVKAEEPITSILGKEIKK